MESNVPDDRVEYEDSLAQPNDSMSLRIRIHGPGRSDKHIAMAIAAGSEPEIDEYVILYGAEFPPGGMVHMRKFIADRVAAEPSTRKAIGEVVYRLRHGEIAAATIDQNGRKHWIELERWMRWDAGHILRVGLLGDADLYIVVDRIAAGLGEPPWSRMEWDPIDAQRLNSWCLDPVVATEAFRRALDENGENCSERACYAALSTMWGEARKRGLGNPNIKGTPGSIGQVFLQSGTSVRDLVLR